ncbi:MAG: oligosaccharide flippase family protein, partial [bacterium]
MGNILKGILSILFSSVASIIIGLIYQPLLARLAGLKLYGEIATFLALYGISHVVFSLGMFDAIRKHVSDKMNEQDDSIIVISLFLPIIIAVIFFIVMVILLNIFSSFEFIIEYKNLFYILGIILVLANMWTGIRGILY